MEYFITLFKETTDPNFLIRRVGIGFGNVVDEKYETVDLFTDENKLKKEKELQKSIIEIKKKYGKNAVIKGMDLEDKATTIKRNDLVGGHNAGSSSKGGFKDGKKD
jgi:DNA polymerase V